ncbi:hypothetical protein HMPREF1531_00649 [Propionibacterium sp. oral taxon 192 str. F0372]|nr:hypothetical protein HMPREF1531_00649 [Propionibacterium sp. oral taxon 192 str. F0372]
MMPRMSNQTGLPVIPDQLPAADQMTDLVVIGSGAGALTAAIRARLCGWEVLLVEPSETLGGPEAYGPGFLWLPGRQISGDGYASARDYFDRVVGDFDATSTAPRRLAYLNNTAPLAEWLTGLGIELSNAGLPDNRPEVPSARTSGRVWQPRPLDASAIGQLADRLPQGRGDEDVSLGRFGRSVQQLSAMSGRRRLNGGAALIAGLLAACQRLQVSIWWNACPQRLLVSASSRVHGVVLERSGRVMRVFAPRGVILAQGGFEADARTRREHIPASPRTARTVGPRRSEGARHVEWAAELGLQLGGMDRLWPVPALWDPAGQAWDATAALAAPHGILVDASGRRFVDETGRPDEICRALSRCGDDGAWLVIDQDHRRRNRLGPFAPGKLPNTPERETMVATARTLPELAWKVGIDVAGLQATAERFDDLVASGHDDDHGRGEGALERPRTGVVPAARRKHRNTNPSLGALSKGPFHAVRVVAGDRGTKGGLVVDENARVLRTDGNVMDGLWAVGSAAASVTSDMDPAPGAGLSEAMVFARLAAASIS